MCVCLHDIAPSIIGLFYESPVRLIAHIYCSCVFVSVQLLNHYNFIDCVYAKYASLGRTVTCRVYHFRNASNHPITGLTIQKPHAFFDFRNSSLKCVSRESTMYIYMFCQQH